MYRMIIDYRDIFFVMISRRRKPDDMARLAPTWNTASQIQCAMYPPSIADFKRRLKTYLLETALGLAPD